MHPLSTLDSFKMNLAYSDIEQDRNFAEPHDENFYKAIKSMQMGLQYLMFTSTVKAEKAAEIRAKTEAERQKASQLKVLAKK